MRVCVIGAGALGGSYGARLALSGADVTGIDCRDLVWGLGSLHCASREQPAGRPVA